MHQLETNYPLLTASDVAIQVRKTPTTVRNWAHAGILPAVRVGPASLRFRQEDVDELIRPLLVRH